MLPASRFAGLPAGAEQAEHSVTHPLGFRAAGVHAGIKKKYRDLALLVSERPCASAAVFTTNAAAAAPVLLTRETAACDRLRAVVVNSGNANACTGKRGLGDAARMRSVTAGALRLPPEEVAVCSTGVIGVQLPIDAVVGGVARAARKASRALGNEFATTILTTDRFAKRGALTLALSQGEVRLGFAAKGGGMISPNMATMLCFVTTDAVIPAPHLQALLARVVGRTFNRVTVDGQQSTNDTAIMLANGASGVGLSGKDLRLFEDAFEQAMLLLALALVADGEGATKVVRLRVEGAADPAEAEVVARAVANSPLVQSAFFGGDPNWGRIVQAVGQIVPPANGAGLKADVAFDRLALVKRGVAAALTYDERRHLQKIMQTREIDVLVSLTRGQGAASVFFSDLTYEYVTVNSEYN
jgi:glutamate N-acetyltransferase / amino-acid N-acetyltransferase